MLRTVRPARRATVTALFLVLVMGALAPSLPDARAQDLPGDVYSLTGNVTDQDGKPLADASVLIESADAPSQKTRTDADGRYAFEGLAAGNHTVSAAHDCCLEATADVAIGGLTPEHTLDIQLERRAAPGDVVVMSGRVVDTETRSGVAGVSITIENSYDAGGSTGSGDGERMIAPGEPYPDHHRGYDRIEVTSASDGTYEAEVHAGYVNVRADHPDYDVTHGGFEVDADVERDIPLRPSNARTVTISGTLVDDGGEPVNEGSVSVSPHYEPRCEGDVCYAQAVDYACEGGGDGTFWYECRSSGWDHDTTGPDGTWRLVTVPGSVRLSAWAPDHLNAERILELDSDRSGIRLTVERIPPDSVTITGRVLDARDGSPIDLASVQVENQRWGAHSWAQTDDDGTFSVETKPGYVILTVRADRYVYQPCEAYAEDQAVMVESSGAEPAADDGGTDSQSPDATTSESRTMPAPCPEPTERDHRYYSFVTSLVTEPDSEHELDVRLERGPSADATIQGWVLNGTDDSPVEGAMVTVYNEATGDWGQAETDADGSYKVAVTPGHYTLRVYAQRYFDGVANAQVASGQTVESTFALTPGQSRWSCCWIAYAEDGAVARSASSPAMAGDASADTAEEGSFDASTSAPQGAAPPSPSGDATFQGGAGGLGPYRGSGANGDGPGESPTSGTPAVGVLVALGSIGVLAVALRRRSR